MGPKEQAAIEGGYFPSSEFADYAGDQELTDEDIEAELAARQLEEQAP